MESGSSMPLAGFVILLLLLWLNGIFYGFSAAVHNLSENEVEKRAQEGDKKAVFLLSLINNPVSFVNAIPLIVMASGVCFGAFIVPWATETFHPYIKHLAALILVLALVIILLASLGILTFRRIRTYHPEKYAYRYMKIVGFFTRILYPFTMCVTFIAKLAARPFGVAFNQSEDPVTEEEIISMVNEGHEQGVLEADETEMITNIFELGDKEAADIMTHRTNMTVLDGSMSLKEAVDFILNEGVNTRYPVYGEDIDDIIGILHMRDAMTFAEKEENKDRMVMDIPGLLREANFIPETRNIDTLFKEMQSRKIHMEIVVDEYGQTAGLLTMEDILEEIVGNIMDEYDEEEDFIQAMEDGTFVMSGLTPLEDVMETLDIELPEEDSDTYDTLNGYLVSRLDRIPQEGENPQVEFGGWLFEVERAGNKMIESVRVVPVPESGKAADRGKDSVEEKYDAVNREYEGDVS